MDIMEANTVAQQFTTHACVDACGSYGDAPQCKSDGQAKTVCDQSGCGLNPFRYGPGTSYDNENNNVAWNGLSSTYDIDTTKPFTVVTQFHASTENETQGIETGFCSWSKCSHCDNTTSYCESGKSQCETDCNGQWCPNRVGFHPMFHNILFVDVSVLFLVRLTCASGHKKPGD